MFSGLSLTEMSTCATPTPTESGHWPTDPDAVEVSPGWDIYPLGGYLSWGLFVISSLERGRARHPGVEAAP